MRFEATFGGFANTKGNKKQMKTTSQLLLAGTVMAAACSAHAAIDITPTFAGAPSGWSTDRYDPTSFSDVGNYQGRSDVLGIGITSAGALDNRSASYQSSFYNTQGRSQTISGGAGTMISADLYIPTTWGNSANGNFRSDIWGVMSDSSASVSDYPILGFSNYGGAARFRIWEENLGVWIDLGATVNYDSWNSLGIEFTGTSYVYWVNGTAVLTDDTINGSTGFSSIIMQAYNFGGDPSYPDANAVDYTAYWSNTPVPEPSTYVAGALLLLPVGFSTLRLMRKSQKA